jgi:hypothetical protein
MNDLTPEAYLTQIQYRESGDAVVLGYIGEFEGGVAKRYKKSDPDYMYKDFTHSYKYSTDGIKWSRVWLTHSQAIRGLLKVCGKTDQWAEYHVLPVSENFRKGWIYETEKD